MECMECNESESVNLGHFLFMSRLMPFCGLILPQGSCDLFFLDLKREARALFLLGAGFHTNKIIFLYHNRDVFTTAFTLASYADALWARHTIFLPRERLLKRMGYLIRPITADFPIKAAHFEP